MAAADLEEESTDAGKADDPTADPYVMVNGVAVRVRTRPEPVHTATCSHCSNQFWFRKSQGWRTHDGKYASWRIECGWCSRPQFIPIDEDDCITDTWTESEPREDEL